jgi:hypothetical protein
MDEDLYKKSMNTTCDWAVEGRCVPGLVPRRCQYSGGCNKYVHHPCTIDWAIDNNIEEDGIAILCREHHPEYQRYTKQNSLSDTKWSGHSHSSLKARYPGNNDHYKDHSHNTVNATGEDLMKSVETHGKYDNVSSKESYYKGRKQDVSKVKLDWKNDSDERSRFDNDKKCKKRSYGRTTKMTNLLMTKTQTWIISSQIHLQSL